MRKSKTQYSREWRAKNPIRAKWISKKADAKRRGIEFDWEYDDFYKWCMETNYHNLSGRKKKDMTIDRKEEELGY
jgi:hypothetical protein